MCPDFGHTDKYFSEPTNDMAAEENVQQGIYLHL